MARVDKQPNQLRLTLMERFLLLFCKTYMFADVTREGMLIIKVKFLNGRTYILEQFMLLRRGQCDCGEDKKEEEDH